MMLRGFTVFVLISVVAQSQEVPDYEKCMWIVPQPCGIKLRDCTTWKRNMVYAQIGYPVLNYQDAIFLASQVQPNIQDELPKFVPAELSCNGGIPFLHPQHLCCLPK